MPEGCRPISHT